MTGGPPGRSARPSTVAYLPPWRIELTTRPGVQGPSSRAALVRLVAATLEAAGAPRPASVGVILSDDAELTGLNERAMGHAGPTDVLSFPLLPPTAFPPHAGQDPAARRTPGDTPRFVLPPGRRPHLGEVLVSVERAVAQAREGRGGQAGDRRWEPADEVRLLVVHGLLHVCGWDHARTAERAAMRRLEQALLHRPG